MTAGYSRAPLAKKLGIKEGMTVLVVGSASDYLELVAPLPADARIFGLTDEIPAKPPGPGGLDMLHLFTNRADELHRELVRGIRRIKPNGAIWVSWYKKASKMPTEITEDSIRNIALPLGLVDVKVCAVDENWSGLKLVIRKEDRV